MATNLYNGTAEVLHPNPEISQAGTSTYVSQVVKTPPASAGGVRDSGFDPGWEDPRSRKWQPLP